MEIITQNAQETQKLGEKIGLDLKNKVLPKAGSYLNSGKIDSRILCLYGDLGSGKTTFIQGLARGLGVKKRIVSPTFVFIRQYKQVCFWRNKISPPRSPFGHLGGGEATTSTPARCSIFYHIDLYRIEKAKEAKELGLEEIFSDPQAIVAIEWAEKIKKILPKRRIDICFDYVSENQRKINIIR